MARASHTEHLSKVPLFSALSNKDLQKVARASDEVSIPSGKVLMEQGQTGREAFVILEGEATVKRNGKKVAALGPGACFGELALLDRGPRTMTVEAASDMKVLVLGQREFSGVIDEVPGLAHKLLASLANMVRDLDQKAFG
jgi:CRP/FNR family transcriptional regulator, cyclic AMP receptor protein